MKPEKGPEKGPTLVGSYKKFCVHSPTYTANLQPRALPPSVFVDMEEDNLGDSSHVIDRG